MATDEDDRVCLLRDLDLFLDRDFEGGSEFEGLMTGKFAKGKSVPPAPGLSDRERRGQAIAFSPSEIA